MNVPKLINDDVVTDLNSNNDKVVKDNVEQANTETSICKDETLEETGDIDPDDISRSPHDKRINTPKTYITRSDRVKKPTIKLNL